MSKEETKAYLKGLMGGYAEDELKAAFERVADPDDWKGPISYVVLNETDENLDRIKFAVQFYTGAECLLTEIDALDEVITRATKVESTGYRMGPCGP
jgi:hypothetical protein